MASISKSSNGQAKEVKLENLVSQPIDEQTTTGQTQWEGGITGLIAEYAAPANAYHILPWGDKYRDPVTFNTALKLLERLRTHREPDLSDMYNYYNDEDDIDETSTWGSITYSDLQDYHEIQREKQNDLARTESECVSECNRLLTERRVMCDCDACDRRRESPEWAVLQGHRIILPVHELLHHEVKEGLEIKRRHRCLCESSCASCVRIDNLLTSSTLRFPVAIFVSGGTKLQHDQERHATPKIHWFFSVDQLNVFLASRPKIVNKRKVYQDLLARTIPHRWTSNEAPSNESVLTRLYELMLHDTLAGKDKPIHFTSIIQNVRYVDQAVEKEVILRRQAQQAYEAMIHQSDQNDH